MPKIQIPNPYHKKDPTSFEEVPASTKKNPKKPGKK
jgi:hypothetical protein